MAIKHETALVSPEAQIAEDVVIGPFCIVGPKVKIGRGTQLRSHVVVEGRTTIGEDNLVYQGTSIGCAPQDKKYAGEDTRLVIGDRNTFREHCTVSIGTTQDQGITRVGSDNLFMANVHIAHDCVVGDHVIIANNVALAGHVTLEDHTIVGGQTGIHQFVRVGQYAMVGGASAVLQDVPPFVMAHLNPGKPAGLNVVGLRRAGFTDEQVRALRQAYSLYYRKGLLAKDAFEQIRALAQQTPCAQALLEHFVRFIEASSRGVMR